MTCPRSSSLLLNAVAIFGLTVLSTGPAMAGLADSPWPMFQHDPQHSGRTDVNGPQGPTPKVIWSSKTVSRLRASVSMGPDGRIFVPNGKNPLSAYDPGSGIQLWESTRRKGGLADRSQPAVSDDGVVYIGARDNDLWACDRTNGDVNWRYHVTFDGDVTTPPTIATDGTIFMGSDALGAGWLFGMNPDGTEKWMAVLQGSLKNSSPALSPDEQIVYVSIKTAAIALDANTGAEIWRTPFVGKGYGGRRPNFAPAVSNDGAQVYFISRDGLYGLDANTGVILWLFTPLNKQRFESAPAIGADGTIYIGASKGKNSTFYALDPVDGTIRWSHDHLEKGHYANNQPAIGADGKVYVAVGKVLYAFDGDGDGVGGSDLLWQLLIPGRFDSGVIIGAEGVLYVGSGKFLWKIID